MRQDLQSLRGLAIIFVFLYHLYPAIFVNGFLGVDIFFVLSGYLMARNLTKKKIEKFTDFTTFYYKRFKRILPLYYLIVLISFILVHYYLGHFWWEINWRYSLASLFLSTNQLLITDSREYFKQFLADEKSPNVFLHLWSLGVEMQFYLIAPFILLALQCLKSDTLKFIAVLLTTVIGFIPFLLLNAHFAFNFMPLRLWQFAAGFCALFWSKINPEEELPEKSKTTDSPKRTLPIGKEDFVTVGVAVLIFCVFPSRLDVHVIRPIVTLTTAFLIVAKSKENKVLLKLDALVYTGNISYIVYLVHWPVLTFFSIKETFQCNLLVIFTSHKVTVPGLSFLSVTIPFPPTMAPFLQSRSHHQVIPKESPRSGRRFQRATPNPSLRPYYGPFRFVAVPSLVLTIISSVLFHHLYEKPYLQLNWIQIVSLVSSLILANALVQYSVREHHFWGRTYSPAVQNLIDANEASQYNWASPNLKDECVTKDMKHPDQNANGYAYCLFPPGNGTLKINDIGNSYAENLNEQIRDQFHYNYSEFRYLSVVGGFGTYNAPYITDMYRQQVEKYKPDVLFITARFSDDIKLPIKENDEIVQQINDNIKFFEKHVKKIYILGSMPLVRLNFMNHFLQYVINKPEDLEQLNLDQKIADEERKNAVERLNRVKCEKCKIYDLSPVFAKNGKYLTFDRNTIMAYIDNSIHITGTGFKLLEPTYAKLAREATDTV
ncbi:Protein CBG10356 [Caenorhabditis briggsae]|uniref:Protein CBG10356 n=1 Tax=Caenorhabditis briggsae TaxID=6238 RepID=A8XB10_CAEBR|nr:Protein CBG10356 [Caenorhabditis briggsae]CAP29790.2 Protein CBG10356 [Caenorhabditis briggsae]